jgi:hypothetical protein
MNKIRIGPVFSAPGGADLQTPDNSANSEYNYGIRHIHI